jgi:hypothetical protein
MKMHRSLLVSLSLLPLIGFSADEAMTDLRLFSPFAAAPFQVTTKVKKQVEGECVAHSSDNPQERAYRCQSEEKTFQTCFARKYGEDSRLICVNSPWQATITELQLSLPLPKIENKALDMSRATPWALELNDNVLCRRTHQQTRGEYVCNDGSSLSLPVYRCAPTWTIARKDPLTQQQDHVKIARAWF